MTSCLVSHTVKERRRVHGYCKTLRNACTVVCRRCYGNSSSNRNIGTIGDSKRSNVARTACCQPYRSCIICPAVARAAYCATEVYRCSSSTITTCLVRYSIYNRCRVHCYSDGFGRSRTSVSGWCYRYSGSYRRAGSICCGESSNVACATCCQSNRCCIVGPAIGCTTYRAAEICRCCCDAVTQRLIRNGIHRWYRFDGYTYGCTSRNTSIDGFNCQRSIINGGCCCSR